MKDHAHVTAQGATYPVLYDFSEIVVGHRFIAGVYVAGRALLEEDSEGAVYSGVEPSGLAGCGSERGEAWAEFKALLKGILVDMAAEAADFESFKEALELFFAEDNGDLEGLWDEAVKAVKRGQTTVTWANTVHAYEPRRIVVEKLVVERAEPVVNRVDPAMPALYAAA